MDAIRNGCVLQIFINENDSISGIPLYKWIIEKAHECGILGATAQRAMMGFGEKGLLKASRIRTLFKGLPVVIEITDERKNLETFWDAIRGSVHSGLVVLEEAELETQYLKTEKTSH